MLCRRTFTFILSGFLQGATQVLLLRTQINGTCCNTGSRRFLPFSPLLTPTHPRNSSVVLTNCSNGQVVLPGRGKMAGPVPHHTTAAFFTSCSGILCCSHRRDSSKRGNFLREALIGLGRFGLTGSLLSMLKLEVKLSKKANGEAPPGLRSC